MEDNDEQKKAEEVVSLEIFKPESKVEKKELVQVVEQNTPLVVDMVKQKIYELELLEKQMMDKIKNIDVLQAEILVKGRSFAGQREPTQDERILEENKKFLESTGLKI